MLALGDDSQTLNAVSKFIDIILYFSNLIT